MELFDELLLSLITVVFAILIAKIASAAADRGRGPPSNGDHRSVELEELGATRREASEQAEPAVQILGSAGAKKELDDSCFDMENAVAESLKEQEREEEHRSEFLDLAIEEEYVRELDEEKRSEVAGLVIEEESVNELREPVEKGEDDDEMVSRRGNRDIRGGAKGRTDEKEGSLLCGEDEWEGIEQSELEKLFAMAMEYVGGEDGGRAVSKLSGDVQKKLYGLQKVATEGPCYEPQPLALKVSARAKWHSWQRLGNMNPDVAMEQYIALLSESIPGWMGKQPGVDAGPGNGDDTPGIGASRTEVPDVCSFLDSQPTSSGIQRTFEDSSHVEADKPTTSLKLFEKGLNLTFIFSLLSPTRAAFLTCYC